MTQSISIEAFLQLAQSTPVIDVRSPGEFERGHIPGAYNMPLFSNEERAAVGTTYKQEGKEPAVDLGLTLVGPKLTRFVQQARELAPGKQVLVHCWRGGMRSSAMAWLFQQVGLEATTLQKGYKAYRQWVQQQFEQTYKVLVLGGMTGSGKSDVLRTLEAKGHQVVDLEKLACHKGSAFGHLGQAKQPSTEHFENSLAHILTAFDPQQPIWVEDECMMIGKVCTPPAFHEQMREAPLLRIDLPKTVRAERLVKEYANFDHALLKGAIDNIKKRLGGLHYQQAIDALAQKDYHQVAMLTLHYYDKAYSKGAQKRNPQNIFPYQLDQDNPALNADKLLDFMAANQKTLWNISNRSNSHNSAMAQVVDAK